MIEARGLQLRLEPAAAADIWCPRAVIWPRDGLPRPLTVTEPERVTVTVRPPRSHPSTGARP